MRRPYDLSVARVIFVIALVVMHGGCVETDLPPGAEWESSACEAMGPPLEGAPDELVELLEPCCDGAARWVPEDLVPKNFHDNLARDPDGDRLCVPISLLKEPDLTPDRCTSIFDLPGACVSPCVLGAEMVTKQDVCDDGEICAPCVDPRTNEPTAACQRGELVCEPVPPIGECDLFEPEPSLLEAYPEQCADGLGRCVEQASISQEQREMLAPCPVPGFYCVPNEMLATAGHFSLTECRSVGDREGRCISRAIPQVAEMASMLASVSGSCEPGTLCAPCFDPVDGGETGACTTAPCDSAQEPELPFEECGKFGPDALCVPETLVPENKRDMFDSKGCGDGCQEPGTLCVPRTIIDAGEAFSPPACVTDKGEDGRCLSECIGATKVPLFTFGRSTCDPTDLCIPCQITIIFIPISTGACDQ